VFVALASPGLRALAAPAISQAQAQAAIDVWVKGPKGPSRDGSARVVSVRDGGSPNEVIAGLRVKQFPDEDGHISPTEDPADATFTRQKDGRWMLTKVVWDEGRRTATPNVAVK